MIMLSDNMIIELGELWQNINNEHGMGLNLGELIFNFLYFLLKN